MPAQDTTPIKEKIISILKIKGPSLPVHFKETGLSILFISAFLSELLSERKLKTSIMRVGSSPIYFLPGQESKLEKYAMHLGNKEKEAFTLLKEKKFLKDAEQNPPIRVALRAIKDFAKPLKKGDEIFWRFFTVSEEKLNLSPPQEIPIQNSNKKPLIQKIKENLAIESKPEQKIESPQEHPLQKPEKELDIFDENKEDFAEKIRSYFLKKNIKILEETDIKKREFLGIARIESDIGEMEILIIAKDKKKITSKDLENITEKIKLEKRIALLISNGELDKKAKEYFREHKNMIQFVKI